jgi:SulP family sulfate permease
MDLNRELKVAGWANLAAGFVGSPTGYHTLSLSALGFKIGSNSRLVGIFAALLCGTVLWFGASIVSFFPRFILGGLLFFIGLSFLAEWVFDAWFKLTKVDYFLVLFILFVIGTFGFLEGVGVGVLVSVMIFIVNYSRVEVINRTFSGDSMQSNADRSPLQRRLLRQKGDQSYILKLQGFIFFGTAHTLYQHVHKRLGNSNFPVLRYIVFDFRRVRGLDGSAEIAFIKILRLAKSCSVRLVFTSLSPQFQNRLKRAFTGETVTEDVHFFLDLDHGLEWCENQILITDHVQLTEAPQNLNDQLKSIFSRHDHVRILMTYLEKRHVEREHYLIRQGERSEYLYFIESGEFSAQLELEGEEPIRLRTMRAGAIFGEIALYLKIPRSLSIIATQPGNVYQLSAKALKEMETAAPDLAMAFQNYVIRLLAERLVDLNRTLEALSD